MIADSEILIGGWLRNHADVRAITTRVVSVTPSSTSTPWVRVIQLDARNEQSSVAEHLIDYMVQLDCFAGTGGLAEASLLARTVRAAVIEMGGLTISGTVVTGTRVLSMARIPDTDFEPAKERYALTVGAWAHG